MPTYVENKGSKYFAYLLVAVVAFGLGWQLDNFDLEKKGRVSENFLEPEIKEDVDMDLFWTVWEELDEKYIDKEAIKNEKMVYGAVKGMVDALDDPYTVFMTPEETKQFNASLDGKLEGIGAELTIENENLVVVTPLRKSPAEKAGLTSGDLIYKINGELTADMTLLEAIMKIRGEKGTTVILTILRAGVEAPFDVSIVRDSIEIASVTVEKLDGDIVYLSVNQFNDKTNEDFSRAISEMILDEPKGMIVDLRFNGGGYLDIAVELLSYLLPSETAAVKIKKRGEEDEVMKTNGNPKIVNVPLVVLINNGSASASEILAGAIQDHKRGIVMGTKSFGKGTVQEVEFFNDGSSIRMTIAKWLTPNGRDINKVGLKPDIVVELTKEDLEKQFDRQKEEARKYLQNLGLIKN